MYHTLLILLPLVAAFTGWFTARVLLWMVLYPLAPRKIMGITFHGFLLKNQAEIAARVADGVVAELATGKALQIGDSNTLSSLQPMIEQHLDSFLRVKLKEKMPVIASFIGDSTIGKLKEGMMEEIQLLLPEVIATYTSSLITDPGMKNRIAAGITTYPTAKIEAHLSPYLGKAMTRIPVIFGLVGLLIGLIMSLILLFMAG